MPEFVLEGRDTIEFRELTDFVQGYIECMFFTNASCIPTVEFWDADSQERIAQGQADGDLPSDAGFQDLNASALAMILADCEAFQTEAADLLAAAYATGEYDERQAGRDFWYTRCGHGCGFWDREAIDYRSLHAEMGSPRVGEPGWQEFAKAREDNRSIGDKLSDIARRYGERWVSFDPDPDSYTGHGSVSMS